jgi:hypothetical protein
MRRRWAFILSLALGLLALCLVCISVNSRSDAKQQLTEYFLRNVDAHGTPTEVLYQKGDKLLYFSMPAAALSALCLFVSLRKKEPAWRWTVWLVLFLYTYLVLGPI